MLRIGDYRREIRRTFGPAKLAKYGAPRITIIIPAYRSANTIGRVIDSIGAECLSGVRLRVIVCCNGTKDEDDTGLVASRALQDLQAKRPETKFIVTCTEDPGESRALNSMVRLVQSEIDRTSDDDIVISINDDVVPSRNSILSLYLAMRENCTLGAIGIVPQATQFSQSLAATIAASTQASIREKIIIGKMFAFRPHIIGIFPEDLMSEDLYLIMQACLHSDGFGVLINGDVSVSFTVPDTLTGVLKEMVYHWRAAMQFNRRYPEVGIFEKSNEGSIKDKLRKRTGFPLHTRVLGAVMNRIARLVALLQERRAPSKTAVRERIETSVFQGAPLRRPHEPV